FTVHLAVGWGQPAAAIDPYIEFRRLTNDASIRAGDRAPGYHALGGALRYFGEDELDAAHKTEMRNRIIAGPPFSLAERETIQRYCLDDARALARLLRVLAPTIPSLPHALFRGAYSWALACQEHRGIPVDMASHERIRHYWEAIRLDLVTATD